jgi:endoglucanase
MVRRFLLALLLAPGLTPARASAQPSEQIRLNQVGFWTDGPKRIVIIDEPTIAYEIRTPDLQQVVHSGIMGDQQRWVSASSEEYARIADFSDFTTEGTWVLTVEGLGASHPFEIRSRVHEDVARAVLKAFWYARASAALPAEWAGPWARPAGHPDTNVQVHASAATAERPAGTVIQSPRGWYDAGDYNKYVVNSGITTATLLMLYEHFPAYFDALDLDIPESGNGLPDLLDEVLWNLRWMMTMQDPDDGGVYHKLTTANFAGMVMPHAATAQRYVVQKSSAAALDFAAVAAIGARVFSGFPATASLADSLLDAASRAWDWAQGEGQDLLYNQGAMNAAFDPDINTGAYGDGNVYDEYQWAAAELFITTEADSFLVMFNPLTSTNPPVPSWGSVATLGLWSLAHHRDLAGTVIDTTALRTALLHRADELATVGSQSAYGIVFGNSGSDFVWGSNAVAANQGNMLLVAWQWTRDDRYLRAAQSNLDYLLGRNAVGYSFVTGIGDRTPMHPHHRPSEADGVVEPVPGFVVGGPNPGRQDGCAYPYPANQPARSYVDHVCSYASNEVAINWQASIAYLVGALEAIRSPTGLPLGVGVERGDAELPTAPGIEGWPNPAAGIASYTVSVADEARVWASLYDVMGRRVADLIDGDWMQAGRHVRSFDTSGLPAGVYLMHVEAGRLSASRPWVVVR